MNCAPLSIVLWANSPRCKRAKAPRPAKPAVGVTPVQQRILDTLAASDAPMCASAINAAIGASRSTTHDNMKLLVKAGLVRVAGREPAPQQGHYMAVYAMVRRGEVVE